MTAEVEKPISWVSTIPKEVIEELPPIIRDKFMEQTTPMIDFGVDLDSIFESIRSRLDPSKGIRMRRFFDAEAIKRKETTLEFYNQPREIFDRRRLWGKDLPSYWKIDKKPRNPNEKKLVKINVRNLIGDPFKDALKAGATLMPEIKEDIFNLLLGPNWRYSPPQPPATALQVSDDDEEDQWDSGTKATNHESRVMGSYEPPPVSSSLTADTIQPVSPVPVISPSESKHLLSGNFQEFSKASKALNAVSQLLNIQFPDESRYQERHRLVATLVADEIPKELNDSFFNEESVDESSNLYSDHLPKNMPNENDCQAKSLNRTQENLKISENNKTKKKGSSKSSFAIDLLEVNYRRPNAVRRRIKTSTSIANWVENNLLCEFQRSRSLTTLEEKSQDSEFNDESTYECPKTPYSTLRDYHLFHQRPTVINGPFVYRGINDELKTTNSIDDFIKQQKRDAKVFHVYEALCKKKFPTPEKKSEPEMEECYKNVDFQCQDEPSTDSWASRDEYLDHWWKHNGKYLIISQDTEDPGYLGSVDDDSQRLQCSTESEASLDTSGNHASLDHLSHTANFDADEKPSAARLLEYTERDNTSQTDISGNEIYSRKCHGSSAEADVEDSIYRYSSPSASSPVNEDCMVQWIRPVTSTNHSSVQQERRWGSFASVASKKDSVEYVWNLGYSSSELSQGSSEEEAYNKCPCHEKGKRKLLRYLGQVYAFCSSKLKQKL